MSIDFHIMVWVNSVMIANQKAHNMENSLKNLVFWESLDMVKGTLSFALDGEFFGIALSSEALK